MSHPSAQRTNKKQILKISLWVYLGIFLIVALVWSINLGWHAVHLIILAKDVQSGGNQVQASSLIPLVGQASGDLDTIYSELHPLFPLFNAGQQLPWIGPYLGQVEPWLTYAYGLSQAGNEVVQVLAPLLEKTDPAQPDLSLPERATQVLISGQDRLLAAASSVDLADSVRDRIQPDLLPGSVRPLFTRLDSRFSTILAGVQFLQSAPQLLGAGQARNYLILAQNRDELRATGGFISGIGLLSLENGKITRFDLGDSYAIDDFTKPYPNPPEALQRFMLADYWVPRDANWSPDFPTAAAQAQELYTLSTGIQTQGVVAFNQLAIRGVLQAIGPVQVPGTEEAVTADNVENYMRQAWAPAPDQGLSPEWWSHRKDFMQLLGTVIMDKVLASSEQDQLVNLAKIMVELLDKGQLLVYFNNPPEQAALETSSWDGALHSQASDYLYLVDSNVGFNKMDAKVRRQLAYRVDLTDLVHPVGEVSLAYQNTASGDVPCKQEASYGAGTYQDMQLRCYWDYWRVYTPSDTRFLTSNAQPVPADELLNGVGWSGQVESLAGEANTNVFAGLLVLPVAGSSQTTLSYSLPGSVVHAAGTGRFQYSLTVQVQPGLDQLPFRLEVMLPGNAALSNSGEPWVSISPTTWAWEGTLYQSKAWTLAFEVNP